jgi:YHS domain-containing protein
MLRFVVILLVSVLLITILRSVLGIITRGFSDLMKPQSPGGSSVQRPPVPMGGELKRDPVCGTYIAASASVRKVVKGETLYFCSPTCRDKYPGA